MSFFAYFHHGGVFRKNGQDVVYDNGTKDAKEVTNLDKWSYFSLNMVLFIMGEKKYKGKRG